MACCFVAIKMELVPFRATRDQGEEFTIATWNLRVPFPKDDETGNTWASRRAYIAQAIASTKPDLLGLQEDCYFMTTELLDAFKLGETYSHYGRFSMNGEEVPNSNWPEDPFTQNHMRDGEFNSVWWNRERFQLKSNKTFWVSPAPSVAGSSFGEITGRVVNCVWLIDRLRSSSIPRELQLCNTHLPDVATKAVQGVPVLVAQMSRLFQADSSSHHTIVSGKPLRVEKQPTQDSRDIPNTAAGKHDSASYDHSAPKAERPTPQLAVAAHPIAMFITGDFNAEPGSSVYQLMTNHGFTDTRTQATVQEGPRESTADWHSSERAVLDYVWMARTAHIEVGAVRHIPVLTATPAALSETFSRYAEAIPPPSQPSVIAKVPVRTASDHIMVSVSLRWSEPREPVYQGRPNKTTGYML